MVEPPGTWRLRVLYRTTPTLSLTPPDLEATALILCFMRAEAKVKPMSTPHMNGAEVPTEERAWGGAREEKEEAGRPSQPGMGWNIDAEQSMKMRM